MATGKHRSGKHSRRAKATATAEPMTLNDVATLLVMTDPSQKDELSRAAEALRNIAQSEGDNQTAELLRRASAKLDRVVSGKLKVPERALAEVTDLIDEAFVAPMPEPHVDEPSSSPAQEESAMADDIHDAPGPDESPQAEALAEMQGEQTVESVSFETGSSEPEVSTPTEENQPNRLQLPADADTEMIPEFITECLELLEGAEEALLALEANPGDLEAVNTVFRGFHTIKGTAAFLELVQISELAHRSENLLSRMRDQQIKCCGGYADLALRSVDMLKATIGALQDAFKGQNAELPPGYYQLMKVLDDPEKAGYNEDDFVPTQAEVEASAVTPKGQGGPSRKADPGNEATIRVRLARLDSLIDTVGELVIAQAMVAEDQSVIDTGHVDLQKKVSHLGKIVRELQKLGLSMRMVPLKGVFRKMTRVVRDISNKNGKQVDFVTVGEDTEIDRNMVDFIADPLVHMVRNAVDHGLETPEERRQAGKPPTGVVNLSAYHASGNVVVQLRDDGRGLDRDRIINKAVERGLIESDHGLSDSEIYHLIFEPGFSTAAQVTDISGRGVGMDVVRRNIEKLQGKVDITSEPGKGSLFTVKLPLTLAISDGMLVRVGSQRYIIPTHNIFMSFRPDQSALSTVAGRGELVRLRDELLPLFRLSELFSIDGATHDPTKGLVVIANDGEARFALLVDELLGQQQFVVKSLGPGVGQVAGVSGAAILGDGQVGLILEPSELAELGRPARRGTSCSPDHGADRPECLERTEQDEEQTCCVV